MQFIASSLNTNRFPGLLTLADEAITLVLVRATTKRGKTSTKTATSTITFRFLYRTDGDVEISSASPHSAARRCSSKRLLTCRCLDHRGRLVELGADGRGLDGGKEPRSGVALTQPLRHLRDNLNLLTFYNWGTFSNCIVFIVIHRLQEI